MPDPSQQASLYADLMQYGPQAAAEKWYRSDPGFRQFADSMSGKTPQQAFAEQGLDFDQIMAQYKQMTGGMR